MARPKKDRTAYKRDPQSETKEKPCLGCDKLFNSHGPHNRLCNACQRANDDLVYDPPKGRIIGLKII